MPELVPLENIAHAIQVALTPVFLLSGIATLINVFSTRLGRVADRVDHLSAQLGTANAKELAYLTRQLAILRRRTILLDIAVVLGGTGAGLTCLAALLLFVSPHEPVVIRLLVTAFGLALVLAMAALCAFLAETMLSGLGVRSTVDDKTEAAEEAVSAIAGRRADEAAR